MADSKFKHNQDLLYQGMRFLYHSSTREHSIIQMYVRSHERLQILRKHPSFYVDISRTVYFKVLTADLVPLDVSTNRAAAHLLIQEE